MTKKKNAAAKADSMKPHTEETVPIVGLGASAGGLEALKIFFSNTPASSGMAFVVVVHMAADKPSMMPELLQKTTKMPVTLAQDGQALEPDHVYIIPPDKDIVLEGGCVKLKEIPDKQPHLPIDTLFRSLARATQAAAVVLSGTGSDGSLGVKEIKASDGLVLVQSPESAKHDGMPRSAMATGAVDIALPPEDLPDAIAGFFKRPQELMTDGALLQDEDSNVWLEKLFAILRTHVGHDFSAYKRNTLLRRITRRMALNQIESSHQYIDFLRSTPDEVDSLFRELLIGVTSFFRDPQSYEILQNKVLPQYLDQIDDEDVFRVWIPGCSTGEEVYSLAILFRECLDKASRRIPLQIFGTDIDKYAIDKAREGLYPTNISADVTPERLRRHFIKEGEYYRIRKSIRDTIVFSVQDIIKDPPFSHLNFLCCRNLLIYLNSNAQKRLLPLFHYTLKPGGVLVLGSSETIGGFTNLFQTLDSKWKIFKRQEVPAVLTQQVDFPSGLTSKGNDIDTPRPLTREVKDNIGQLIKDQVLERFSPAAVLIDEGANIFHVSGRLGKYLETTSGPPSQNALTMARKGLRIELSSAIRTALANKTQETRRDVRVKTNGDVQRINLHVCPLSAPRELAGKLLVVFEDVHGDMSAPSSQSAAPGDCVELHDSRVSALERELQNTREGHQTITEELESSNEELKSTNEELQSSNEELQSSNEEMESSKEELQSLNEELQTVNSELQSKVDELSAAHDDMRNLLNSTEIATIFVDNDMQIKRFTQEATTIVNLIPSDIGRPLKHVMTNLASDKMMPTLEKVLKQLITQEVEVQTTDGTWFKMRVMPYRTMDNRIDGGVLTFSNIDEQKLAQIVLKEANTKMEDAWQLVRNVFDLTPQPMIVLDGKGEQVLIANTSFMHFVGLGPDDTIDGTPFSELLPSPSLATGLGEALQSTKKARRNFALAPMELDVASGKVRTKVNGISIQATDNEPPRVLLYFVEE